MPCNHDHPWLFHRDEVDLLEEDVDEIYRVYGSQKSTDGKIDWSKLTIEQQLIQEQIETEERADAEFSERADLAMLLQPQLPKYGIENEFAQYLSLRDELVVDAQRTPFYEMVFEWSQTVFELATLFYENFPELRFPAFRVYVNVKLIPIKLSVVFEHHTHDDPLEKDFAEKECAMALLYLERVLESLVLLAVADTKHLESCQRSGARIKQILKDMIARMKRHREGFERGFV